MRRFFQHIPRAEATAVILSIVVGVVLLLVKFVAFFLTGSAAIFSDALENIVNVLAAVFAAYALATAHRPADREHPYGHGKIEFLSAGFEGGMILLASVVVVVEAVVAIRAGAPVAQLRWGFILIAAAMATYGVLGLYLVRVGRQAGSITLEADGKHLLTDALTSAVALAALLVVHLTGWRYADPVGALLVAAYIARTGISLLRRSAAGLMDEQDEADERLLSGILDAHTGPNAKDPRICSYHKLRHRHSGRYHWVDFHLVVPGWWDIDRGHRLASRIEYEIEQAVGTGNATAHVEPCPVEGCASCQAARAAEAAEA